MTDFRMPSLGADMEAGTLVEWLVKPGDKVSRGDVVAVVETQKGAIDIEIFSNGTVAELVVPVGARVPVGTVLARLDGAAAATPPPPTPAPAPVQAAPPVPVPAAPPAPVPAAPPRTSASGARLLISPAARRYAIEHGVDTAHLRGTGLGGAITLSDVQSAAVAAPRRRTGFDPAAMRQAIAAAMSRSKREIPHYYLGQTVEISAALKWIEGVNRDRAPPDRVLPSALFLCATARALAKTPELNGFWEDGMFRPADAVHVGWAIALRGGGLVAPAIRDADKRTLDEVMAAMRDLVLRARSGGLRSSELTDPTITITSLGDRGAESVLPIIYPPQVAMVGFGRMVTRPWVVDGAIGPRPVIALTLAGDHRASDGHRGGLLLAEIERLLGEPGKL
jgi:pyruvate dehydrogenase E2 component (dihydrolipoamide acetyltransferase)